MSNTKQPIHPPNSGQDIQYERLLMEELSIKKDRKSILESQSNNNNTSTTNNTNDNTTEVIQSLKIRSMLHRVSLESMLLSAQYTAAAEGNNKSKDNNTKDNGGMDNPESTKKNALIALSIFKSNQLEEDDNSLPLVIDSESLEWRKKFTSNIIGGNNMKEGRAEIGGDADDFFSAFPECKRKEDVSLYQYNEMDESDSDSDDDDDDDIVCIEQKKPKAKRKQIKKSTSSGGQPSVVTSCSSSSPSPEKVVQKNPPCNGMAMGGELNNMRGNNVQNHYQQNHNQLPGATNPYQQQQQQQHNHRPSNNNNYVNNNNPYQRHQQQNNRQWQQNGPQHQQQQQSNGYQQQPAFDYGDSNSFQGDTTTVDQKNGKANPFRTAKELGPNYNDKNKGGGNNQRNGNDWDNGGGNNNQGDTYNNNNNTNGQRRGGMNNNTLPGGTQNPGNMVRAAIRGPKDNISAGLKRKFQPPMKRDANGNNGNNNNSSSNNNRQGGSSNNNNNNNSNNKDEEELPEELKGLDKELIEKINNDIVDSGEQVSFDDIAGLQNAKDTVNELVIMPMLRPELFTGLRACPKGLLLFGPPGTGEIYLITVSFGHFLYSSNTYISNHYIQQAKP